MYCYLAYALGRTVAIQSDFISVSVSQKIPLHGKRLYGTKSSTLIRLGGIVGLTWCMRDGIGDFGTLCQLSGPGMGMTTK